MSNEGQTAQKTEDQFHMELSKAMQEGNELEVARLMGEVELEGTSPAPDTDSTPNPEDKPDEPAKVEDPQPSAGTPPKPKEDSTPPAADDDPDAWMQDLDDAAKERIRALKDERDNLDRRVKSELGRLPHLQRALPKLESEVERLKRELEAARNKAPKPDKPVSPDAKQSKFAKGLAQLKELDPALAEMFEAMQEDVINPLRDELGNEINQVKNVFTSKEEEVEWRSEKAKLLERFPQADEIFQHPLYREWKHTLTPGVAALAGSDKADDVAHALEIFARYAATNYPELAQADTPAPTPAPATAKATPSANAAKVEEDRKKKLAARTPGSGASTPKFGDGLPETEEELHEYFKKKIRAGEM